jgi:ABC-2 type transport system ATP-binding protein
MLFALHDVTKTYGRIVALRQLSVTAPTGAVGLLGPNGAGKTTLIRTILGLINVDSGHGEILGMDVRQRRLDIRQAAGFVPEDECLFPGIPGVEFVAYAAPCAEWREPMLSSALTKSSITLASARRGIGASNLTRPA